MDTPFQTVIASAAKQSIAAASNGLRRRRLPLRRRRHPQNALDRKPKREQFCIAAHGTIDLKSDRQAAWRHARVQRQAGNAGVAAGIGVLTLGACLGSGAWSGTWTSVFPTEPDELVPTGRNPYFILEPGYTLVLEGGDARLTITVLNETKKVDGVETRVVEERETKGGQLIEVARNYFAISKRTNDVFYFGEDVDMYKDGKIINHEGTWLSGVNGSKFGLIMPGRPLLNARYYQEVAPKVAMDRATIVSVSETVETPAGVFRNCLKVEETTPLQRFVTEYKYYCPGIGMVQDGSLKLVKAGKAGR